MTRSHFIEILQVLTKYIFDLGVRLTEFSVTVESVTLRFYCSGISDVAISSVHSEKTRLKRMIMIIINPQRACASGLQ